jgi:hypothetical protein
MLFSIYWYGFTSCLILLSSLTGAKKSVFAEYLAWVVSSNSRFGKSDFSSTLFVIKTSFSSIIFFGGVLCLSYLGSSIEDEK